MNSIKDRVYLLGIDIGGTFTDVVLYSMRERKIVELKVLTTYDDPSKAVLLGIEEIIRKEQIQPSDIKLVISGGTVGINILIEKKGAKTAFLTTEGFQDILFLARQTRPHLFDFWIGRASPPVDRNLCIGIPERTLFTGEILRPLEKDKANEAIYDLKELRVESVAICLLHSYVNPENETILKEMVKAKLPDSYVCTSSEVQPEYKEYERAITTVVNAYIGPRTSSMLQQLQLTLNKRGMEELLIMQSNGGVMTVETAKKRPINIVESGPAAGAMAAVHFGQIMGFNNLISFDMGGTTAKMSLIKDGIPNIINEYEVPRKLVPETGYTLKIPTIDIVEVGAGGGSMAWIDQGGILHVGPRSSGSDPGPICYGRGGKEVTVTDANLVLGRINPDFFAGGQFRLDDKAAREMLEEKIAKRLGLTVEEAAKGILRIANANMMNGLRIISVEKGYDPRNFSLMVFGGAAPAHGCALLEELNIPRMIVPTHPGTFSALGLLCTDLKHNYVQTFIKRMDDVDLHILNSRYDLMEKEAIEQLKRDGAELSNISLIRSADMRYKGQAFELRVLLPDGNMDRNKLLDVQESFHLLHEKSYGYRISDGEVMMVNLRLLGVGKITEFKIEGKTSDPLDLKEAMKDERKVYFDREWIRTSVYDRNRLQAGHILKGPSLVEEDNSTTIIYPGFTAAVDDFGNLIIEKI